MTALVGEIASVSLDSFPDRSTAALQSQVLRPGPRDRLGPSLGLVALGPPPLDHQVDDEDHDPGDDGVVEVAEVVLPLLPSIADLAPDDPQHQHPRDAAERGQRREAPEGHSGHTGGEGDERAHDREHAGEEDGDVAVALEPAVGGREVLRVDVDQPVLLQQLEASVVAGCVGEPRARDVPEHTGGDDPEQGHVALRDVEAGEQHYRLAGDRDARALQRHQDEDARQPGRVDEVGGDIDDRVDDEVGHSAPAG